MKTQNKLCIIVALCSILVSCDGQKVSKKEKYRYNVLISKDMGKMPPNRRYVGTVTGLSSCKYAGMQYKRKHGISKDWETVCCWYTATSKCQEEHDPNEQRK
tara:strand:- start:8 stop:313 length:306 start_codon:yes stop_codon:yes gene_type:complete